MPTAQELLDLSSALTDASSSITDFVAEKTDPDAPTDPALGHLSDLAAQIAVEANKIGRAAIETLAVDVGPAVASLNFQVGQANDAIARINDVQKVLGVASAVLTAAAGVAASVATGNWIGVASAVVSLAESIHGTLSPASAGGG